MSNTIYWFSGTGNSLYAAKILAEEIGDTELTHITSKTSVPEAVGGSVNKIGFVFPSYYGDLPRLVNSFIEKLNILPGSDLFSVVTMGAFGQGSIAALEKLLLTKGLTLRYGVGVRMPANYIIKYDPATFGAKSDKRILKKLNKVDKQIRKIASEIIGGSHKIKRNPITSKALYTNVESLDADFFVTEKCTACGLCEKLCSANNIKLKNGKPVWQRHCEHCVACISWCPTSAIEYGYATKTRTRYRNPRVDVKEIEAVSTLK
jgi:Pyruvate/2-oxoacid:ferredoxin oxidoreductase delta subunit